MSDDDYAADSPFDGGDDYFFWDDAASQDVADDLAEHTMPSPVYLEDPAYEMMGGYSDWEYYSDDYYDDDPNLLKNNPQAGSPPASMNFRKAQANSHHRAPRHGKRRKPVDTEEIPSLSLDGPELVEIVQNIGQNIIGTTWKVNKSESEDLYQQGEATRVALLKDWRSVFWESQPKSDRRSKGISSKTATLHDGWANDLSLADMGLMTATGKCVSTNDIDKSYDQDEDEDSRLGPGGCVEDVLSDTEERAVLVDESEEILGAKSAKVKSQSPGQLLPSRKRKRFGDEEAAPNGPNPDKSDIESQLSELAHPISKRRKTGLGSSASTQKSNTTDSLGDLESQVNSTQKRGRGDPKKEKAHHVGGKSTSTLDTNNATAKLASVSAPTSKKRKATTKATASNDDGETITKPSSRAVRVASENKRIRSDDGKQPKTPLAVPTTRRTRTGKK